MRPDEREVVFRGRLLAVTRERWGEVQRELVQRPDVVAVVAVDTDGFVTLVRQRREAARAVLVEIPAGRIEEGEEPLVTARRELEEETGLRGGSWRAGPAWWTTPGWSDERVLLFFAEDLTRGEARPDDGEHIEVLRWRPEEVEARLTEIEDAKTLAGLLLYLAERARPG